MKHLISGSGKCGQKQRPQKKAEMLIKVVANFSKFTVIYCKGASIIITCQDSSQPPSGEGFSTSHLWRNWNDLMKIVVAKEISPLKQALLFNIKHKEAQIKRRNSTHLFIQFGAFHLAIRFLKHYIILCRSHHQNHPPNQPHLLSACPCSMGFWMLLEFPSRFSFIDIVD